MVFKLQRGNKMVVDHIMKKGIRKRLETGQNWMNSFIVIRVLITKSLIVENII
ncbi:unnamed protein product [Paramecium sonneborni]|uniref:Uncharacterized protein n=1 Tax=Paramecium sonneborni TaxID=65129 RepID=A0A8S1RRF4_9CILI|nr:unnamed protein product [Paramecium sonneborni]